MSNCLLIDGNNIVFRAFYAFQNQRLKTSDGIHTGALYGFVRMLLKILKERQPDYIAVAFDKSKNTFRRKMYPEYKAKRKPTPPELLEQLPLARDAAEALGIKILSHDDYEADDLLGSLARKLEQTSKVTIVTGDRDLLQLVDDKVTVELCVKGVTETKEVTPAVFFEEYGFQPAGIIELKSLMGDTSDNIPGVKGIGEKKGLALVQEYQTIDNLYAKIETVGNDKMREKLLADKEMAAMSHDLATIRCEVATIEDPSEIRWNSENMNSGRFAEFLIRYQFTSLHKEFIGTSITSQSQTEGAETGSAGQTGNMTVQSSPAALKPLPGERILVQKLSDVEKFFEELGDRPLCLDTETDSLDPMTGNIIGVSLAGDYEKALYVPLRHQYLGLEPGSQIEPAKFFECLKKNLENRTIIGHNLKFDLAFLMGGNLHFNISNGQAAPRPAAEQPKPAAPTQLSLFDMPEEKPAADETGANINLCGTCTSENISKPQNVLFDTMIASYIVDPTRSNALKSLGKNLLGFETEEYKEVAGAKSFAEVDLQKACHYACQDVLLTMRLYERMKEELKAGDLLTLFNDLEMPVMCILLDMECTGIALNSSYLRELSEELADRLVQLEESIYGYAGHEFNVNSTQQLQQILFNELGLVPPKKTKTGYSTDSEVLQILAAVHPICAELIEYRELGKLKSTYADALIEQVNPKTGLIHASFNQTVTATGRLSSSNPNLQNIPIKSEWGRKIRRAFLPPRAGDSFISIDYSQIELRLLAHFSMDKDLVKAFTDNIDIHAMTAGHIFNKPPKEVTSKERSIGKTVNFGIIYGISAHGLAQDLGISRPEAKEYIDSFYAGFPDVTKFFDGVLETTKASGRVETMLGRVRQLEDINSSHFHDRTAAERMAKNTRLQGSAADLVKKAMIDSVELLKSRNFKTKLILQIHDELVFSAPQDEIEQVTPLLKNVMETCVKLNIPLTCDVAVGPNLADLTDMP